MLFTNSHTIRDVILFLALRPEACDPAGFPPSAITMETPALRAFLSPMIQGGLPRLYIAGGNNPRPATGSAPGPPSAPRPLQDEPELSRLWPRSGAP